MTPIEFHFVSPDGTPIANTEIEIQLAKSAFDNETSGVLMPRPIFVDTDAQGKATVPLWPNPSMYYVSVYDRRSAAGLSYKFLVPETEPGITLRLQDIVVQGPAPVDPWEDAVILQVLEAKASSMAAMAAAQAARDLSIAAATSAQTDAMNAGLSVTAALGHRNAAADFATMADQDAIAANTAREEAESASTQAGVYAGEAAASAAAVDGVVDEIPDTVYSTMVAALREGTNVDLTFDGVAKTVTINATVSDGPEQQGPRGYSAYEVAVSNGYIGTETDWLLSLDGADGEDGEDGTPGASAYQLAVADGYVGTLSEWIASLKGAKGDKGDKGDRGNDGTGGGGDAALVTNQQAKVSKPFTEVKKNPVRILIAGSSIASFDKSAILIAAANLQKHYGKNETSIVWPAISGGNYDTDNGGRQKQVYGGAPYIRMAMKPGDANYTNSGYVDGFRIAFGCETDGGAARVLVDGLEVGTLNCSGPQSYNNVFEWFDPSGRKGYHTLTIEVLTTGWVYVERIELVDLSPGFYVENATMGGGGLHHMINLFTNGSSNNKPGQDIEGNNGIDAWFGRTGPTAPGLILVQHFTNDTATGMEPILERMAEVTAMSNTPVVLSTEAPALSFITPEGGLDTFREPMRQLILSYGSRKNIAVIDWSTMLDYSNVAAYEARYLPSDDKTHVNAEGYAPQSAAFSDLFNIPNAGVNSLGDMPGAFAPPGAEGINPFGDDPYALSPVSLGSVRNDTSPYGSLMTAVGRAVNFTNRSVSATVFASSTLPNLLPQIEFTSGLHPVFGAYKDCYEESIGEIQALSGVPIDSDFTLLMLASSLVSTGLAGVRMVNPGTNDAPKITVNGVVVDETDGPKVTYLTQDRPVFVYITIRRGQPNLEFRCQFTLENIRLYGAWAVEGAVPVIASRSVEDAYLGFPVFDSLTTDPVPNAVKIGQVFHATSVTGATKVKKRALDMVVYKPLQQAFGRGYEMLNKNADGAFFSEMDFIDPSSGYSYFGRAGGLLLDNAAGYTTRLGAPVSGETMTIGMRSKGHIILIRMDNGGSEGEISLNDAGEWVEGNGALMFLPQVNTLHMNLGYTFTMPTGAMAAALGANPRLFFEFIAADWIQGAGVATLASGASACI